MVSKKPVKMINFFKDNFYKKCVDFLEKNPKVAFVCTLHESVALKGTEREHCHGGIGCTHVRFLKELVESNGSIPYHKSNSYDDSQWIGEIQTTNAFVKMGYSLAAVTYFPTESVHDKTDWSSSDLYVTELEASQRGLWKDWGYEPHYPIKTNSDCTPEEIAKQLNNYWNNVGVAAGRKK